MIVVDSSALVAILFNEPERHRFLTALGAASHRTISVATVLEAHMVVAGQPGRSTALDELLSDYGVQLRSVDEEQLTIARAAFDRFGKGRGHPARLNFGDCFAYAPAKSLEVPLLYKGGDFAQTDIGAALA